MDNLVGLKKIIDELVNDKNFHITYPSLRQAYRYGSLNKDISKFIIEKKKCSSTSYYIAKDKVEDFKSTLLAFFS